MVNGLAIEALSTYIKLKVCQFMGKYNFIDNILKGGTINMIYCVIFEYLYLKLTYFVSNWLPPGS